ncbi:DUF6007 family protein [Bacillus sp. WMMC1349]|uniref:DUF6007 family protein n=1 Tax=Bacillus sp. WMMC1349 TaxID=2736254 RepID=UPI0035C8D4AA
MINEKWLGEKLIDKGGTVMRNNDKDDLYDIFRHISMMEVLFFLPIGFLFVYLPVTNFLSIFINLMIVILCVIGFATFYHVVKGWISPKN